MVWPCCPQRGAGSGVQAGSTAQLNCRQQPCGELHKLPIWQPSPAGEGHRGPAPAAIPVSVCPPGLLPRPSCLERCMGDPPQGSKWSKATAPPSPALPWGGEDGGGAVCVPVSALGTRALGRAGFP